MIKKNCIVVREPHLGELIFIFCDCCAVCVDSFTPLWCTLALEEDIVGVLG